MARISMRRLFLLSPPTSFDSPVYVPVSPLPPSLPPSNQMASPLTEHWHQMCSSSVGSGTSWAECASGSVNENGSACARVCVCMRVCVLFTVVQWHVTVGKLSVGEGFKSEPLQLNSAMQCSTAHPPRLKLYSYPSRINALSLPFCLSLHCIPLNILVFFFFFICRAVSHNPHLPSYIIIYSFL